MSTLSRIRTKVRRLTRSLSDNELTDAQIDEYTDDFVLYDFPEHLRLFALRQSFSWICDPFVDEYTTDENAAVNALVDFKDNYITTHSPIYINGDPAYFSQDETEFYAQFPLNKTEVSIGTGDGVTINFTKTLSDTPIKQNSLVVSAVDVNSNKLAATDDPTNAVAGDLLDTETAADLGSIGYQSGDIDITFGAAPKNNTEVQAQFLSYVAQRPTSLLYFQNKFVLRPIPDRPYEIRMEVYKRPSSLGNDANASPELDQWWQYIAYGVAKKVFEDRSDLEGVASINPEFKKQEMLVQRRTIVQQTDQRAATIYQFQTGLSGAPDDFGNRNL